jgi:hypothetical protein
MGLRDRVLRAELLRELTAFHRLQLLGVPELRAGDAELLLGELTALHRLQLLGVPVRDPDGVVTAAGRSSVARVTSNPARPPMPSATTAAMAIAPTLNLPTDADSTLVLMPHLLLDVREMVCPRCADVGGRGYRTCVPGITRSAIPRRRPA